MICLGLSTDKVFLRFFFKRVRVNKTGRYGDEFPFVSPCGPEMNFLQCDDQPVVFTHLVDDDNSARSLAFGGFADTLRVPFQPSKLCMLPQSGRLYHPAPERTGGIGLIKSQLTIELSPRFVYDGMNPDRDCPTHFMDGEEKVELDHSLLRLFTNNEEVDDLRTYRRVKGRHADSWWQWWWRRWSWKDAAIFSKFIAKQKCQTKMLSISRQS